jgi:hypothetical protein
MPILSEPQPRERKPRRGWQWLSLVVVTIPLLVIATVATVALHEGDLDLGSRGVLFAHVCDNKCGWPQGFKRFGRMTGLRLGNFHWIVLEYILK